MPASNLLDKTTLRANASIRLEDGRILFDRQRYDGAAYISGYAVEFALKARICDTLNRATYPDQVVFTWVLFLVVGRRSPLPLGALPATGTVALQNSPPNNTRLITTPDHILGFKTHKLDTLLLLTGQETYVRQNALAEWSFVVERWTPEMRDAPAGATLPADVQTLLDAAKVLVQLL